MDKSSVLRPRIGGILSNMAWTGGSNNPDKKLSRPKTIFSRRPDDFRGASKIEETCKEGLKEDRRLEIGSKSQVSLTTWIGLMKTFIEDCGMDTVFRVWDGTNEVYLLEDWGSSKNELVSKWVQDLRVNGVDTSDVCLYDIDNLRWSGRAILNSIGSEVWFRIEKELPRGRDPTGPEVFTEIIQHM